MPEHGGVQLQAVGRALKASRAAQLQLYRVRESAGRREDGQPLDCTLSSRRPAAATRMRCALTNPFAVCAGGEVVSAHPRRLIPAGQSLPS